jgi:hypothetical protein
MKNLKESKTPGGQTRGEAEQRALPMISLISLYLKVVVGQVQDGGDQWT